MRISSTLEDRFIFIDISRTLQANAEFLKQFSLQKHTTFPQIRTINLNLNLTETDIPNIKATSWEKFNSLEKLVINIPTTIEGEIYLFEIFLSALRGVPKTIREKLSRVRLYHSSETPISIDNTALIQLTTLYPNLRKLHLTSSKFAVRTISAETLKAFEAKKTTITTKLSPNGLNRIDYDAKKIILDDSIPIKDICTKFPLLETIKIPKSTSITLEDLQKLVMVDSLLNINFETKPTDIDLTKIKKMGMAPSIYFDDEETSE